MKHTNFRHAIIALPILSLALTACVPRTYPLAIESPTRLDDRPLCGLTVPDEDHPWRRVWCTDHAPSGVSDLIRDGDWLWVATPVDIVRLNLRTLDCTRFSHTVGDPEVELRDTHNLLPDPDGRLWATTGSNLVRFDGQNWQAFPIDRAATVLAFDEKGNIWTRVSLYRSGIGWLRYPGREPPDDGPWDGEVFKSLDEYGSDQEHGRWIARSGSFSSPEEHRLLAAWREQLASLSPPEGIAPWEVNQPIAAEGNDRLWVLARSPSDNPRHYDVLLSFDGRNWRMLPWPYGSARLVADETRGGVWAGTNEGLVFSDGRSIQKYPILPGDAVPVGPVVYDLVTGGSGRLWASTEQGLLLYDEASDVWQATQVADGRPLISADDQGGLWVVPHDLSGQVSYFDGETWTRHPFPDRWPCHPKSILADVGGGLWLSSFDCALRGFDGEVWDEYDNGSRGDVLARGPDGAVYAAGENGTIRRYDGTTWETLLPADPTRRTLVIGLAVGPRDEVWVAFDGPHGLLVRRDGEWEEALGAAVTALSIDSQGGLWAGHRRALLHYDGQTWERIEREITFRAISALAEYQGRIWVGGEHGLNVYDPTEE
ncbi:MAG: hypothetical protein SXV54_14590 [Chloroflexota bacterium]|nr:hypothetical protein [Chloroflexota bacterium]